MFILKLILLTILFCTSTIIGMLISKKYSNRVKILKDLKKALNIFEIKINFSFETIPEIFTEIAEKTYGVAGKIFADTVKFINENNVCAGEAWEKAVEANGESLKNDDIKSIKTLGKLLGKTDIEGQTSQIKLVNAFLETQISDATEEKNKNEKMYQKLGAIVGLIMVIVLI
ncbi:MAG: stage III sporulation protein AB [Clostridia bacterium]|nr:stage III sporulation protein AB [Clostridia bacterium]